MYIGEWRHDLIEGRGVLYQAQRGFYVGEFRRSLAEGPGQLVLGDLVTYIGEWRGGRLQGPFQKYSPASSLLESYDGETLVETQQLLCATDLYPNLRDIYKDIFQDF